MVDSTGSPTDPTDVSSAGGQVSDRMQALLSRAVEEQVVEQRAVSSVMNDLRQQMSALAEGVRMAASDSTVTNLEGAVNTVANDVRTSTSVLRQRIEALSARIDEVAAESAASTAPTSASLGALSAALEAQGQTIEQLRAVLGSLPAGLASVEQKVLALGSPSDADRTRDAVLSALGGRLDRLEHAAARPVVSPEILRSGLGDLRNVLDTSAAARIEALGGALNALEQRLAQVSERIVHIGDAAGGVPALATDLSRLTEQVALIGQGVGALHSESTRGTVPQGMAALRQEVAQLGERQRQEAAHLAQRISDTAPAPVEEIAAQVSQRVAAHLVETLTPQLADVVVEQVNAALLAHLGEALAPRVQSDTELVVREVTAESEARVSAHVDEAVLALAEALLRRRRGGRAAPPAMPRGVQHAGAAAPEEDLELEETDGESDAEPHVPATEASEDTRSAVSRATSFGSFFFEGEQLGEVVPAEPTQSAELESEDLETAAVDSASVESQAVEADALQGQAVEPDAVAAEAVQGEPAPSEPVESAADPLEANAAESESVPTETEVGEDDAAGSTADEAADESLLDELEKAAAEAARAAVTTGLAPIPGSSTAGDPLGQDEVDQVEPPANETATEQAPAPPEADADPAPAPPPAPPTARPAPAHPGQPWEPAEPFQRASSQPAEDAKRKPWWRPSS